MTLWRVAKRGRCRLLFLLGVKHRLESSGGATKHDVTKCSVHPSGECRQLYVCFTPTNVPEFLASSAGQTTRSCLSTSALSDSFLPATARRA